MPLPDVPRQFSLPLSPDDFRRALHRGQGRALLNVSAYGATNVEDVILDALVTHRAFNPQLEGDRSAWLMQLVDAAGLEAKARELLVERLRHIPSDDTYWDLDQRCWLAAAFAKRGYHPAREALYRAFRKANECCNLIAAEQIIQVDGSDGLIFLAHSLGDWYTAEDYTPDQIALTQPEDLIERFDELHGKGRAEQILALAAKDDERIAAYLAEVRECLSDGDDHDDEEERPMPCRQSVDEILEQIQLDTNTRYRWPYRTWGRKATEEELRIIFERLLCETDEVRLCHLLAIFMVKQMVQFDSRLLSLAEHPSEEVQWWAIQALANYSNEQVRTLAIDRAREGRTGLRELELFRLNYVPGDWDTVIAPNSQLPNDDVDLHDFLQSVLDVLEGSELVESAHPLVLVYEYSPCSMCRERALKSLLKLRAAPDWLLKECAHDCSDDIRKMAEPPGLPLK